jgi:nucleotide-binding universal stress UspA family protein
MFEKILVPLDGSPFAERALGPALALAQEGQGEVILLSVPYTKQIVVEDWDNYGLDQSLEQSQQELIEYLEGLKAKKAHPALKLRTIVTAGDEAGVIVDTALTEEIDLIVMATHGRSGFSRWMLGSITEKVLRTAPCPVLVIREDKPLSHIMITLDGSALSEVALGPGMEIASRLGSHVTLLSVEPTEMVDPKFVAELDKIEAGLGGRTVEDFYHRTESYLQHLAREVQADLELIVRIAPKTGPVAEAILATIETDNVDLVVMATHGRTGLKRWVYGSVTEKVMRAARCNMLIIRPPLAAFKPQSASREEDEQDYVAELPLSPEGAPFGGLEAISGEATGSPQSVMEKAFLADYLQQKGYRLADLRNLPPDKAKALMTAASQHASLKLAQMESTAHFREKLHRPA